MQASALLSAEPKHGLSCWKACKKAPQVIAPLACPNYVLTRRGRPRYSHRLPSLAPCSRARRRDHSSTIGHGCSSTPTDIAYPYNDGDGKGQKATLEHIFPAALDPQQPLTQLQQQQQQPPEEQQQQQQPPGVASSPSSQAPWQVGAGACFVGRSISFTHSPHCYGRGFTCPMS
ncbi:hypothetical protein Agub_g2534 [Astrephomene gubernaculifera]|uniref:Uncharacterized protein n=1 Tax=Astrephomene gubernaculifera TaxID=47775 RepID=A0AAD3DH87_9CHLO|nr:hypothetical protein Agub_g2534 [Astrephomene gubernaculifera]